MDWSNQKQLKVINQKIYLWLNTLPLRKNKNINIETLEIPTAPQVAQTTHFIPRYHS